MSKTTGNDIQKSQVQDENGKFQLVDSSLNPGGGVPVSAVYNNPNSNTPKNYVDVDE
jgi:hypothetical protein